MKSVEAGENKQVEGQVPSAVLHPGAPDAGKEADELSASLLEIDPPQVIGHAIVTVLPVAIEQLAVTDKVARAVEPGAKPTTPLPLSQEELNSIHSVSPPSSPRAHGASLLSDFVPSAIHESQWVRPTVGNGERAVLSGNLGAHAAARKTAGELPTAASINARQVLGAGCTGDQNALPVPMLEERAAWLVVQEAPPPYLRGSLLLLAWPAEPRRPLSLGSDPGCDIVLASHGVSREHAEIGFDRARGQFFMADLKSTNGTYLQRPGESGVTQIVGQADLSDGCVIRFGAEQVRLVFRCYMGAPGA